MEFNLKRLRAFIGLVVGLPIIGWGIWIGLSDAYCVIGGKNAIGVVVERNEEKNTVLYDSNSTSSPPLYDSSPKILTWYTSYATVQFEADNATRRFKAALIDPKAKQVQVFYIPNHPTLAVAEPDWRLSIAPLLLILFGATVVAILL